MSKMGRTPTYRVPFLKQLLEEALEQPEKRIRQGVPAVVKATPDLGFLVNC